LTTLPFGGTSVLGTAAVVGEQPNARPTAYALAVDDLELLEEMPIPGDKMQSGRIDLSGSGIDECADRSCPSAGWQARVIQALGIGAGEGVHEEVLVER
jgi:hypothetical protein